MSNSNIPELSGRRSLGEYARAEAFQLVRELAHAGVQADLRAHHGNYVVYVTDGEYATARHALGV